MVGWIKLHRKIVKSNLYKNLNSKQRDVMIQCLLSANHDDNEWEWQGQIYKCKPGQFISSLDSLAKECASDVKVQSVRTALLKLEKWGFLTNESTKTGRLISIIKWHTYQTSDEETNKDSNKGLTKHQQSSNKELTTNKNVKNDKNEKKKPLAGFDEFYKAYPKKKSKGQAEKTWNKLSPTNDLLKTMLINLEKAKTSEDWLKDNGKFIPYPSSWLNNKGWEDEVLEALDCEIKVGDEIKKVTLTEFNEHRKLNGR